ncbi:PAS domain-containing sensor histidine kinase [candidate division WWE3 bacterium]|nr:PAS domain-containing sensor histidine kinase [candidate division WWE3 bacterium]
MPDGTDQSVKPTFVKKGISKMTSGSNQKLNGDEQSDLLEQKEEELRRTTSKLHERDQTLSRINSEMYKKNLELLQEKKKAEALLYNITEAAIVIDSQDRIILFNSVAQTLASKTEDEALGKKLDEIIGISNEKGDRITWEGIRTLLEYKQGTKLVNLLFRRPDGKERFVNVTASKVSVEKNQNLYVMIISDVTEEKKAEKAREEFISIASHELRTPMTIIKNYIWMLQNKKGGDVTAKQEEYLQKAMEGTERMIKLITDMLDISRMEQGRFEIHPAQVDLAVLINEISLDFKVKADQKGLEFKVKLQENLPKVRADEDKLREVIVNLIGNAIKYTDSGFVSIISEVSGKEVKTSILDTGRGIDKDDLPKLFHKFGRLDNSFVTAAESGGTGLGLYIVKSIIEAMGGKVGVYSEGKGRGSTFWFVLRAV